MNDLKASVVNWIIIGLMAVTFILVMKWATVKFSIPYLKDVFAAV